MLGSIRAELTPDQAQRAQGYADEHGVVSDYALEWGALALGFCSETQVAEAIAVARGLQLFPAEDMGRFQVDPQAYDLIAVDELMPGVILPYAVDAENKTHIICADPSFTFAQKVIRSFAGRRYELFVAPRAFVEEQVKKVLARRGGQHVDANRAIMELDVGLRRMSADVREAARDSEIIKAVDSLLNDAIKMGASDIHLDSTRDGLEVRVRVDGRLYPLTSVTPDHTNGDPKASIAIRQAMFGRIFILARQALENAFHQPMDGRFEHEAIDGRRIDIRMAAARTAAGDESLAMTLRLLGTSAGDETLDNRGFEPTLLSAIREAMRSTGGFILMTGPTGSGKSTTLHAIVGELIDPEVSIVTIENPVERKVAGLRQFEVKEGLDLDGKMTYAAILRAVLRMDPNIVVAGEIRDSESAAIALQMSNTGHLVLTTLHTNTALLTVPRLRDLDISDFSIANECRLLMAQRLVRRICRHCASSATEDDAKKLEEALKGWGYSPTLTWDDVGLTAADLKESLTLVPLQLRQSPYTNIPHPKTPIRDWAGLRHSRGCRHCRHTGYSGRLGVFSVVRVTAALRAAILDKQPFHVLEETAYADGSRSLLANGMLRCMRGETSISEVLREIGAGHTRTSI